MSDLVLFMQHHLQLCSVFLIAFILLLFVESLRQKNLLSGVTPAQLTQMINRENAYVIDLRPAEQFKQGHIISAQSIPVDELDIKSKKLLKLKARPIVVYCAQGLDATKATQRLASKGITARALQGGLSAWVNADMPLQKD